VLIYERIREELKGGKNLKKAIADGYSNAFSAIADANITTLITGIILVYFGTGPIKGFATTLIIGIITSFFTAVFLSRLVYDRIANSNKEWKLEFTTNITKNWFQNLSINFIEKRKIGYIISAVVIVIAVLSLGFRGLKQGIDFSGGRNYVVRFEQPVSTDDVRETLSNVFVDAQTSVITMGDNNQVRISTNYGNESIDENIDAQIENMLYTNLKQFMNENVTEQMFVNRYVVEEGAYRVSTLDDATTFGIQSSQKVGPTVADDIKTSAIWSILFALIAIALYILIRFRNIAFSAGAVVGLVHDVLFILGIYSIFYSIMPFSLEIDQSFIAAILTVIGYSINDTVVVFDRIRENVGLYPKRALNELINMSVNSTLSRTFSTSFSTALPLLAMFIFGGETIRGFVFAILLGVIVGTYSTIFIASPIAYDIQQKQAKKA
jgi:SecD/SecF fusion protein